MEAWKHLLFSSILAAAFYPVFNWKALLIFAGGFLIDIDHYFWYVQKYRKFNIYECYKFYRMEAEKNNFRNVVGLLLVFHTVEFFLLMAFFSFYTRFALAFTIGLSAHYLLDLVFLYIIPKRFIANHSIIYWIYKNKIQKL